MILLPVPQKVTEQQGSAFVIDLQTMIVMDPSCPTGASVYAQMLKDEIKQATGMQIPFTRGAYRDGDIVLKVDASMAADSYLVESKTEGVVVCGGSLRSMGWGVQTLRQIVRQEATVIPAVTIEDAPDIANRGFYHDATRGRLQNMGKLKELVDTMAFYKMTELQLYVEHTYLFRDMTEVWRDETPLSAEEILELDTYCFERGIELVPSIATFGHLFKLLGSKSYMKYCELTDCDYSGKEFSFIARMDHHTFNVSDPASAEVSKGMIQEFMQLFRTDKFNICADETFDLGKDKSKALAEEKGNGTLYVDFIMELFDFLQANGKTPMFWGDIICHYPELLKKLPKETICLNWGYSETQRDTETRIFHEAGATQYVCPGCCGWNTWVNAIHSSYENIRRMCSYGRTYGAIGVLNTDWGDFGHVNHPEFSIPGLIYGAVMSWGDCGLDYDEMNRQISVLHYNDRSGKLVSTLGRICGTSVFDWNHTVFYKEQIQRGDSQEKILAHFNEKDMSQVPAASERIASIRSDLCTVAQGLDLGRREVIGLAELSLEITDIFNQVGVYVADLLAGKTPAANGMELAVRLERVLHSFQEAWRANSKEGDLHRITKVFMWYADLLRDDYFKQTAGGCN